MSKGKRLPYLTCGSLVSCLGEVIPRCCRESGFTDPGDLGDSFSESDLTA
jgi:hypothetical protein